MKRPEKMATVQRAATRMKAIAKKAAKRQNAAEPACLHAAFPDLPDEPEMDSHSLFAFTLVAAIAIASPGPATLMAINNSLAHGQRSAIWSSLGNGSGLFCLSAAAMLGPGALLASSEVLFNAVKSWGRATCSTWACDNC
jgi:hypothetical protein